MAFFAVFDSEAMYNAGIGSENPWLDRLNVQKHKLPGEHTQEVFLPVDLYHLTSTFFSFDFDSQLQVFCTIHVVLECLVQRVQKGEIHMNRSS